MFDTIKTTEENNILTITLDRAPKMNALNIELFRELEEVMISSIDKKLRAIVITSNGGKAFSAGADIKRMNEMTPVQAKEFALYAQSIFNLIEKSPHMVIAAVDGIAFGGGCELAMACDFIYATKNSKFGQPEVSLGLIPCFGGCLRLPKFVGLAKAKELIFTGKIISAQKAQDLGLVNEVFESRRDLFYELDQLALKLKFVSMNALGLSKQILTENQKVSDSNILEQEAENFSHCFNHPDKDVGVKAFLNKSREEFLI